MDKLILDYRKDPEKYNEETKETNKLVNIFEAGTEHSLVPMEVTDKNSELDNLQKGDLQ